MLYLYLLVLRIHSGEGDQGRQEWRYKWLNRGQAASLQPDCIFGILLGVVHSSPRSLVMATPGRSCYCLRGDNITDTLRPRKQTASQVTQLISDDTAT